MTQILNLFSEISQYHPKQLPDAPHEILKVRQMRLQKKISDEEYKKFFDQPYLRDWLELKWQAELYNRNCFLRLWELYKNPNLDNNECSAVLGKLAQFKRFFESCDRVLSALNIDLAAFVFRDQEREKVNDLNKQFGAAVD